VYFAVFGAGTVYGNPVIRKGPSPAATVVEDATAEAHARGDLMGIDLPLSVVIIQFST
jgi:hypothetical protein